MMWPISLEVCVRVSEDTTAGGFLVLIGNREGRGGWGVISGRGFHPQPNTPGWETEPR